MKNEEIEAYVRADSKSKLLRAGGMWLLLSISIMVMMETAETSSSAWFALTSGLVVSTIFTLMLVVLPEQWKKDKTVAAMLHIPSFILEAENGGFHTWSKNQMYCDTELCSLKNVLKHKEQMLKKSFNPAQIKITLEHSSEALHLFENSIPAAMSLSSGHGLFWIGMTSSIKKFSDVYEQYKDNLKENESEIAELYYLYGGEFVHSLESFIRISENKSLLFRIVEMCKSHRS